jgi:hypothetical protein
MTSPQVPNYHCIIRRTRNGWVVIVPSEHEEDTPVEYVYEDSGGDLGPEEALMNLLQDVFDEHFQQKHRGGLAINLIKQGREKVGDQCDEWALPDSFD